jgi:hypothetical protein
VGLKYVWRLVGVLSFIVLMLGVGAHPEWVGRWVGMSEPEPFVWQPTPSKDPWRLTVSDLNYQRVLMNWWEKVGFHVLGLQLSILMVGLIYVVYEVRWIEIWMKQFFVWVSTWRWPEWLVWPRGVGGTVRITARNGVIYVSQLTDAIVEGMEEFGFLVSGVKLQVTEIRF